MLSKTKKFVFAGNFKNLKNKIAKNEGLDLGHFDNLIVEQNGKIVDSFYFKKSWNTKLFWKKDLVEFINKQFNKGLGWGYHFATRGWNLILSFAKGEK